MWFSSNELVVLSDMKSAPFQNVHKKGKFLGRGKNKEKKQLTLKSLSMSISFPLVTCDISASMLKLCHMCGGPGWKN